MEYNGVSFLEGDDMRVKPGIASVVLIGVVVDNDNEGLALVSLFPLSSLFIK